ncbi:GNAT family N-acetyltransferase [Microbacterium protaetiae]|uniref:GNAT family N-acetyltransferase n=1 Tax=Microbacterium protaetiae TaxID=2509458 RepID=A0A4P6EE37_9MICO|nr:GNAT family N-acetyltransferase [Microbacterium protaetiae]QAY60560.1 GNAT family N-acetyltransferase [Microbacterium protaetiae]
MSSIRPFRTGDEPALAEVCVRTAAFGGDATGVLSDDEIWPAIFALPYVRRHPDAAFVAETDDGRVAGYIVCAPDSDEFENWFAAEWWPPHAERWPDADGRSATERDILSYANGRGRTPNPWQAAGYPAHLHIDLLPELQGQGLGRLLIETLIARLRELHVPGVHLVAPAANAGAVAFYPRVGFTPLFATSDDDRAFGRFL